MELHTHKKQLNKRLIKVSLYKHVIRGMEMKREPKVKNKGKVALFLLVAGGVFLVKLGFKFGTIHMIRVWFENTFS